MLPIATSMLSEIAGAFVIIGVPLILAAWFAGPSRLATRGRRLARTSASPTSRCGRSGSSR